MIMKKCVKIYIFYHSHQFGCFKQKDVRFNLKQVRLTNQRDYIAVNQKLRWKNDQKEVVKIRIHFVLFMTGLVENYKIFRSPVY